MNIGEFANKTGTSEKTIRYYESIGVLPEPSRDPNGYRNYSEGQEDRVRFVVGARALGIGLSDVRPLADAYESGRAPCEHVFETIENQIQDCTDQIAQLAELRATLISLKDEGIRMTGSDKGDCVCSLVSRASDNLGL